MPASPPDSSDSPPPSATPFSESPLRRPRRLRLRPRMAGTSPLFLATVVSVFATYHEGAADAGPRGAIIQAAQFTCALLAILLAHEFGHYIAARLHKVDASLPYFIPMPLVSPFGTMGAVIRMRSDHPHAASAARYRRGGAARGPRPRDPDLRVGRRALASSSRSARTRRHRARRLAPLASARSPLRAARAGGDGCSRVALLVRRLGGNVRHDDQPLCRSASSTAGTSPIALFGPRQNRSRGWVHRSMLAFFFVSLASFVARDVRAGLGLWHLGRHVQNSLSWLVLFEVLAVLGSLTASSRRASADRGAHEPVDAGVRARWARVSRVDSQRAAFGARLERPGSRASACSLRWRSSGACSARRARALDHPPTGARASRSRARGGRHRDAGLLRSALHADAVRRL